MREGLAEETAAGTVDPEEVARFARIAKAWWEPEGEFRPLHKLNPVRLAFIRDRLAAHFGRDPRAVRPFTGLTLLDIGCGGGLVSEPLARLGFTVTGIDAGEAMLDVARGHAAASGVSVDYRRVAAEDLAAGGERFDAVLALEVVEHVASPELFLAAATRLVRPGGAFIAATINRTPKAFLFAIVGAEYLLRWLPRGTHHWDKFLRPSELAAGLRAGGLVLQEVSGLAYNPLADRWSLSPDIDVNYLLFATKPAEPAESVSQP
ncbi:MAG TPA: bifunctional 2-polyprenyl-6-hydroxyphenol methylase/3-demethylubiquinol 3-O-methyltransferase UbiG [Stellaceae bacterium]|jgi:2-polyprenyl-6-hydroxyphenyl methylase / 3-demethylubiquinone-9 3-methyltransferase|nr:bifunctional 2-polyprenyl-6-hydroxyphenol methylase/3-demethylubiquinol 3-O-methyltransferase UbiG [Stellaceae bacterium]